MEIISPELKEKRKEEILLSCRRLYAVKSYREISFRDIAEDTSFTRTSIYNYFHSKEEIFLYLLQSEYKAWADDLEAIVSASSSLDKEAFGTLLGESLEKRETLLKLLAMNLYDIEANSRVENLVELKREYKRAMLALENCLLKFFPSLNKVERISFIYSFLPFVYGLYPYCHITPKQKEAMDKVELEYIEPRVKDVVRDTVVKLLG